MGADGHRPVLDDGRRLAPVPRRDPRRDAAPRAGELFRVYDPDDPREIILVRDTGAGTGQWLVVRGDQGTMPVPHEPGFRVEPFITAEGMVSGVHAVPGGHGLVLPNGRNVTPTTHTAPPFARHTVVSIDIPAGEYNRGVVYEGFAWGWYSILGPFTAPGPRMSFGLFIGPDPGGQDVGQLTWPFNGVRPGAGSRWRMHGLCTFYPQIGSIPGAVSSNITVHLATTNTVGQGATTAAGNVPVHMFGPVSLFDLDPRPASRFTLWVGMDQPGDVLWVQGGRAWRAA